MKILLNVIAVCLVMLTVKLYTPDANANLDNLSRGDLMTNTNFSNAVKVIIEKCELKGHMVGNYFSGRINC